MKQLLLVLKFLGLLTLALGCQSENKGDGLSGTVSIDGSSTVFPITEAIAEEFRKVRPNIRVTVGVSGTGGGFKKFIVGETDINDASRSIKESEVKKAVEHNVKYIELPVAYDGITVVVNPENDWTKTLTVEELKAIWKPGSTVTKWKHIREGFPDVEIKLYGPGTDSGTFDYFTEAINGKSHVSRSDFTKSEDDNVLVQGVAGDKYSLGFFGFAYYKENKDKIQAVAINNGNGDVLPTLKTINNGTYAPLSRPVFIYLSSHAVKNKAAIEFVKFYLHNAKELVKDVGYVPLEESTYEDLIKKLDEFVTQNS